MLEIEALTAGYGPVRALDAVSLSVPAGQITAVLGANGAGKTTLLRTISGLLRPRSGRVRLAGADITRLAPEQIVRRGLAHVPAGRGVITELSVEENLRLGGLLGPRADRAAALEYVYGLFPALQPRAGRDASTLSGGERQMLTIGRALMSRPQVLLLDEPSLGLAPLVTAQIMELLKGLCDSTGLTVLLVEQNARSALSVAHGGVVLSLGSVVTDDVTAITADEGLRHAYLGF